MILPRRSLLRGISALLAAPAIVRIASIMPVRVAQTNIIANVVPVATPMGPGWDGLSIEEIISIVSQNPDETMFRNVAANAARFKQYTGFDQLSVAGEYEFRGKTIQDQYNDDWRAGHLMPRRTT